MSRYNSPSNLKKRIIWVRSHSSKPLNVIHKEAANSAKMGVIKRRNSENNNLREIDGISNGLKSGLLLYGMILDSYIHLSTQHSVIVSEGISVVYVLPLGDRQTHINSKGFLPVEWNYSHVCQINRISYTSTILFQL